MVLVAGNEQSPWMKATIGHSRVLLGALSRRCHGIMGQVDWCYPILLVDWLVFLVTGDVYFTDGRVGTGLPHDARGWLGDELRAWCLQQGLH